MKPTEFTVRQLREATDTPPTVAFDCAVWLANQRAPGSLAFMQSNERIVEYINTRERK